MVRKRCCGTCVYSGRVRDGVKTRYVCSNVPDHPGQCIARIGSQGKSIYLDTFQTDLDAARAYDRAARQYHGRFARLNFPEEWVTGEANGNRRPQRRSQRTEDT